MTNFYAIMDIPLLEAIMAVVESSTAIQTAELVGVAQPVVSTQLARLEGLLRLALVPSTGNRLRPTSEAPAFRLDVESAEHNRGPVVRADSALRRRAVLFQRQEALAHG